MKRVGMAAVLTLSAWVAGMGSARATVLMQKQAKTAGVEVASCLACHGEKLPKKGASTLNEKGKWLVEEKAKRKAKEIDGAWLKEYVEKK